MQKHIEFNVDPWESIVAAHTGCGATSHSLEPVIVPVDMQTADDVTASNARRGVDEVDAVPMVVEPCTSSATDALTRYIYLQLLLCINTFYFRLCIGVQKNTGCCNATANAY